jgi:hypothetical protein
VEFGKEGILYRLQQLDNDLLSIIDEDIKVEITIVGGSAISLLDLAGDSRMTTDIDVIEAAHQAEALMGRYDMNRHADTFLYQMPERWRERRQKLPFDGAILEVYAPSNEDLAILKLLAYRNVDRADLDEMVISGGLDLEKLFVIIEDDSEIRVNFSDEKDWQVFLDRASALATFTAPEDATQ